MPEKPFQEKTEQATPKRKQEARRKGQVGKSKEVVSLCVLVAGILFLFFEGKEMAQSLGNMMQKTFLDIPGVASGDFNTVAFCEESAEYFLKMVLPIMLVVSLVAVLANYVQIGFIWSVEPLAPKVSKINPVEGAKRIFSKRSLVELGKSVAKIIIVGWAAFSTLKGELGHLAELSYQDKIQILSYLGESSLKVVTRSCYVIALLALLDYLYQRWEFSQSLKMTKQEVKEEFKQTEGDPMVKARIRSIQREMARRRMMEEVKKADVVITNPTHLSVALRYDSANMSAPKVVAKGAEKLAFKIRKIASDNGVPLFENKALAQNLYKTVDIGQEIPNAFYRAVAEILAYVYGLKKKQI
jgi:flagellar biosynthetic protein FlhB